MSLARDFKAIRKGISRYVARKGNTSANVGPIWKAKEDIAMTSPFEGKKERHTPRGGTMEWPIY